MLAREVNNKWDAFPIKGSTQAPSTHISNYQSRERESYEHDETSMTEIPVCPWEHFLSYKTLSRLVPCYKRDWATCCTVATTCYLLLFACYVSPHYTITCYRYFQCLQLLPCWNPLIRAFFSSLGSTLLLIKRTRLIPYTCGSSRLFSGAVAGEWSAFGKWKLVRKHSYSVLKFIVTWHYGY